MFLFFNYFKVPLFDSLATYVSSEVITIIITYLAFRTIW